MPPVIRPYAPGDETGILDLYRVVFALNLTPDEWRWYYGNEAIIVVAESEGRIVGHYAVQPRPFSVMGESRLAGLVMGSMVAPEFRNITTFIDMAKRAYELCRERLVSFVYAFPNDNVWLVRRRMLDWTALPSIVSLVGRPSEGARDVSAIERVGLEDTIEAPWSDSSSIRAAHSSAFLMWRFNERPGVEYPVYVHREGGRVRGYIALKRYESTGHIVAFRVEPGAEASTGALLFARANQHFRETGVERISMWSMPASPLHSLVVAGMTPEGAGKNFGYLAFDPETSAQLADGARWDIAMCDSDVY
jgi:hypothetical protein